MNLYDRIEKIKMKKGVRQGDNMSPKLFIATLEDALKQVNWADRGIHVSW